MTQDAYAHDASAALAVFLPLLCEDLFFALASGLTDDGEAEFARRRGETYVALLSGKPVPRADFSKPWQGTDTPPLGALWDDYHLALCRALATVAPPRHLPMGLLFSEKVTLLAGAGGLRGLFTSKPSDKEVQRVKRLGSLAVRALKCVYAADAAELDAAEKRVVAAVVMSLGLPDSDAKALVEEPVLPAASLDVYGDVDKDLARAILHGLWLAAADDAIDPREEEVIKTLAEKLAAPRELVEELRAEASALLDARRAQGLAAIDGIRFVLADMLVPWGNGLATEAGLLLLPKRFHGEVLAQVQLGAVPTLGKRHKDLTGAGKELVLALAWTAALWANPTLARRAALRARHDRFATDLGGNGEKARARVERFLEATAAPAAFQLAVGNV
jgi:hypothetical protein